MRDNPMNAGRRPMRAMRLPGLVLVGWAIWFTPAWAQNADCSDLRAQIDAGRGDSGRAGRFDAALRQQQYELDRTRNYSESIGCNAGMFFGAPPQCPTIEARIERMQENIDQLRQQMQDEGGDGGSGRRALIEQYNTYCGPGASETQQAQPADPDAPDMAQDPDEPRPARVHSKALCVRHCDGGFFPITDQATSDNLERLGEICKALCPNTEASLYTVAPSADIDTAVAPDGTAYTALPAAFKYQKTYDPTCSCKPEHKSWVEALADAEALLEKDKSDVIVTKKMSDAMSRPVQPSPPDAGPKPPKKTRTARKAKPPPPAAADARSPGIADRSDPNAPADNPGEDITRQFRRSEPTL